MGRSLFHRHQFDIYVHRLARLGELRGRLDLHVENELRGAGVVALSNVSMFAPSEARPRLRFLALGLAPGCSGCRQCLAEGDVIHI